MKKVAAALCAVAALVGTQAFAAARITSTAPGGVYSWAGFYAGGNVGYGWGWASDKITMGVPFGLAGTALVQGSDSYRAGGLIGGVQAGYNWQIRNFLLGVETDFQASGQKGSGAINSAIVVPIAGLADATAISESAELDWFGTLRARLGITRNRWLVYATGGLAYGQVKTSGVAQPAPSAQGAIPPASWNSSTTKIGWAIGAGVENALTDHWRWRIEYLYLDLGKASADVSGDTAGACIGSPGACSFASGPTTGTVATRFTDNILRVGLNYRF